MTAGPAAPAAAVWLDGRLVDPGEARVGAFDHGLTVGDGVFETLRVYRRRPFALRRHLDRMERSAAGLGLALPDRATLERAAAEVVDAAGLDDARLRITVTGGPAPLGSGRGEGPSTTIAAVTALDPVGHTADVVVVPWIRNERSPLAGLKTTSYGENVVALAHARGQGADEAIFANSRGELCEGTGTNIFLVLDGTLVTPPLRSGCLAGVTRELIVERCDAEERDLPLEALAEAEEAFLTSSTREAQGIAHVDGRPLPAAPGPVTVAARSAFAELVATDLDP